MRPGEIGHGYFKITLAWTTAVGRHVMARSAGLYTERLYYFLGKADTPTVSTDLEGVHWIYGWPAKNSRRLEALDAAYALFMNR